MGTIWSTRDERAKANAAMFKDLEECMSVAPEDVQYAIPVVIVVGFSSDIEAIIRQVLNPYNVEVRWHCDPSHLLINGDAIPKTTVRCFAGTECCELAVITVGEFCEVTCLNGMSALEYSSMLLCVRNRVLEAMELLVTQGQVVKYN